MGRACRFVRTPRKNCAASGHYAAFRGSLDSLAVARRSVKFPAFVEFDTYDLSRKAVAVSVAVRFPFERGISVFRERQVIPARGRWTS